MQGMGWESSVGGLHDRSGRTNLYDCHDVGSLFGWGRLVWIFAFLASVSGIGCF